MKECCDNCYYYSTEFSIYLKCSVVSAWGPFGCRRNMEQTLPSNWCAYYLKGDVQKLNTEVK